MDRVDKACRKYCTKYVDGFEQAFIEDGADSLYKACEEYGLIGEVELS